MEKNEEKANPDANASGEEKPAEGVTKITPDDKEKQEEENKTEKQKEKDKCAADAKSGLETERVMLVKIQMAMGKVVDAPGWGTGDLVSSFDDSPEAKAGMFKLRVGHTPPAVEQTATEWLFAAEESGSGFEAVDTKLDVKAEDMIQPATDTGFFFDTKLYLGNPKYILEQ